MSVRSLLAFIDEFDRECRRREFIERAIFFAVAAFLVGGVLWLTREWSPYLLKSRVDALEQRVKAIEKEEGR